MNYSQDWFSETKYQYMWDPQILISHLYFVRTVKSKVYDALQLRFE